MLHDKESYVHTIACKDAREFQCKGVIFDRMMISFLLEDKVLILMGII